MSHRRKARPQARHRKPTRIAVRRPQAAAAGAAAFALTVALPAQSMAAPAPNIDQVERKVAKLYHSAEQAAERYNDANERLTDAKRRWEQARRRADGQREQVAGLRQSIGSFAAAAYRNGGMNKTLQLVFSEDPRAFLERAASLEAYSTRQAAALRRVVEARAQLQADEDAAAQEFATVERTQQTLASEKADVENRLRSARQLLDRLEAEQRRALAARASRAAEREPVVPKIDLPDVGRAAKAVRFAYEQLGDRYVWAADGPDAYDCSGLTKAAWEAAGVSLPHSSAMQYAEGDKIPRSALAPGDLVYFYSPISHVGIYIGNGQMIHAPNPSRSVEIAPITQMPYAGATRP